MIEQLLIYPLLLQMALAIILMFAWNNTGWQKFISITGSVLNLALAVWLMMFVWQNGTQTVQAGNWEAPFGITFVADTFSALFPVFPRARLSLRG